MPVRILGISRKQFQRQLVDAISDLTGSPIKKPSRINRAMVMLLHGGDGPGQNEHTLDSLFVDALPAQNLPDLERDVQLMINLHPEIATDYERCVDGLAKAGLNKEEAQTPLLALTVWLMNEHDAAVAETSGIFAFYRSSVPGLKSMMPRTSGLGGDDISWAQVLKKAAVSADPRIQATMITALYTEILEEGESGTPQLKLNDLDLLTKLRLVAPEFREECRSLLLACIDSALADYEASRSEAENYGL